MQGKVVYVDYLGDGTWGIGSDFDANGLTYPRIEVCRELRRLISCARDRFGNVTLIASSVIIDILKSETWKHEGWEQPESMIDWVLENTKFDLI